MNQRVHEKRVICVGEATDPEAVRLLEEAGYSVCVSRRQETQDELIPSEANYRAVFCGMSEGFAVHEILCDDAGIPTDYVFLEINEAFERLTGLKRESLIGRRVSDVLPGNDPHWVDTYGKVALTGEPIRFENYSSPLGKWYEVYAFSPAKRQFAALFTDITDRRKRREELARLNRTLRALSNSSHAMTRARDESEYLDEVCRIIVEDCGHAMVWIGYAEGDESRAVRPVACSGFEEGYLETLGITWADTERGRGPTGTAVRTGKPSMCANMLTDPRFEPWRQEALKRGYASSIVLPLLVDGDVLGAVTIYSQEPDPFSEDEAQLLGALADDLSYGIAAFRLREEHAQAEEELQRRKDIVDAVARNTTASLVYLDREFNFIWVNPAYAKSCARTQEEFVGRNHFELYPHEENQAIFEQVRDTGMPFEIREKPFVFPDHPEWGVTYWDWTLTPILDSEGVTQNLVFSLMDVTHDVVARKEIERLRIEAEQRAEELQVVLDAVPAAVWIAHDTQNDQITGNRMANQVYEAEGGENVSANVTNIRRFFQDGRELAADELPMQYAAAHDVELTGAEFEVLLPSGARRTLWGCASPLHDASGQVRGSVAAFLDTTERTRAEKALRDINHRLDLLSETASRLLLSENPQGVVQDLCESILTHLDCHAFFNYLVDEERQCLHLNAYGGIPEDAGSEIEWLEYGTAVCGCAARDACRIVAENIPETPDPRTELVKSFGILAYACHPLLGHDGGVIGTLSFGTRSRTSFSEADLALMKTVADHVAAAMERMRLHEAAERRAAELESFTSHTTDGMMMVNEQGDVIWTNEAGKRILRVPPEEDFRDWISRFKRMTLDGEIIPIENSAVFRVLRGESVSDFRYRMISPTGEDVLISVNASPVVDHEGRVVGGTFVLRDASDAVALELQREELYQREHRIASVLQQAIVPPDVPTDLYGYVVAVKYRPALKEAEIGGDFYDVFDLGDGKFGVIIGDVSGKGLPAAIRVAEARHTIRSYAFIDPRPARVMTLANEALCRERSDEASILTAFFAVVDTEVGAVTFTSAGHEPPIVCGPKGVCDELEPGGMPLGVIADCEYTQSSRRIDPGDIIVMVTDGITEARAEGTVLFGSMGVIKHLRRHRNASPAELAGGLLDAATAHAGGQLQDDAAIVVLERNTRTSRKEGGESD